MSRALPDGEPQRLTKRRRASSSSRRSRATASGSSTRPGTTREMGRVRVIKPDGSGGRDVVAQPGPLRRAVVLAGRPEDRVTGTPAAIRRAGRTYGDGPRHLRRAGRGRRADAGARGRRRPGVRSHRHAHLSSATSATRSPRCSASACRRRDSPLPGRDEIEHVRSDNATQYAPSPDGKWIAFEERFKTFVAPFPRTGRPSTSVRRRRRIRCSASRATPASISTGRATAAGCTGRSGPSSSRAISAHTFTFVEGGQAESRTSRRRRASTSASPPRATSRTGTIALVGARVITMAGLKPGPIQGTPA